MLPFTRRITPCAWDEPGNDGHGSGIGSIPRIGCAEETKLNNTQTRTEYQTRHVGLAALLRYAMGDESHLRTEKVAQYSTIFTFSDSERCAELERVFFSRDGAATGNARELLDCVRVIRATVAAAQRNPDGVWNAGDGL